MIQMMYGTGPRSFVRMVTVLLLGGACSRGNADQANATQSHAPAIVHAVSFNDAGVHIDPIAKTLSPSQAAAMEYQCSQCDKIVTQQHVHVIPWFNQTVQDYVTTFRCDDDWLASLQETRAHFVANVSQREDREKFTAFFTRHAVGGLNPADLAQFKADGLSMLNKIQQSQLILSP